MFNGLPLCGREVGESIAKPEKIVIFVNQNNQILHIMKLRHLFLALLASAASFVGCDLLGDLEDLGEANVSLDLTEIVLPKEGGSKTIQLVATRDWEVKVDLPDWLALSANGGKASLEPQSITITVDENKGNDREATITFSANFAKASVLVKQEGAMGEIKKGSGTKEDPYTVAGAIEYINTLTGDSPIKVYIKGKVCKLGEDGKDEVGFTTQYGNGTFRMSDDGANENSFYAYRINYLGNKKFTASDTDVKVGDEVIVYGNVVNFKGNTPETVSGTAFLFSLNGVDKGGDDNSGQGQTGEAKGSGTEADPFNVAAAIAKAKEVGQTESAEAYYIKGKVAQVKEAFGAQYGNGTFELVDEGFDAVFTAFRILYFGNQKWAEGDKSVKEGDELVVVGKIVNFKGNTPETSQGSGYLYSLNGEKGNATPPEEETKATPAGDGSQSNPFNVSAAIDKAKEVGETATEKDFYVKGKVSKITEQFGAQYGNGTFVLVDEGYTAVFTAYRILYFGGEKWQEGDATVAVNDEIVAVGKIVNFKGNTPEITQGGYLYSLNGQTSMAQTPVFGVESTDIKVSAKATSAEIKVKGNVAWTVSRVSDGVTCTPTSGEGAGKIVVSFPANESEDTEVSYSVAISTEADVTNNLIVVNITQAKAGAAGSGEAMWDKDQLAAAAAGGATVQMDDYISFVNSSSYSGSVTELRVYKSQTLTIKATNATITDIEFVCTVAGAEKYGPGCFKAIDGYSYNDKQGRWAGSASEVVFTAESNQVRIVELKVHYTAN